LRDLLPLGEMTPGAEVLLAARTAEGAEAGPLVVVQHFGKGRVAVVGTASTWRWAMEGAGAGGRALHERFWGQLVRWAAGRAEADDAAPLVLSRRVLTVGDELVIAAGGASERDVPMTIAGPDTSIDLVLTGPANRKQGTFRPSVPGRYEAKGEVGGRAVTETFFVEVNPAERRTLKPATDALFELARASGGGLVELPELDELPRRVLRSFPGALQAVEETPEKNPVLFLIFCGAVFLEWFLRRRALTV
jgi:hypothetical protein